jgi:putative ABC transport system ATP-binding protein
MFPVSATAPLPPVAVRCRNIVKSYGEGEARVPALRGIDLDVHRGELLMLVGPSGCGKTSLISVMAALLDPDSGDCFLLDADLQQMTRQQRTVFRGRHIGFVFQAFNLLPALSALDNVAAPLLIQGLSPRQAEAKARAVLDRVGLADHARQFPGQLSGGQQQRVAIARALVHDPDLIICDEPTSSLDHATGHDVMQLLRESAKRDQRTLIVVTHDLRILEFADRIAQMEDGRIVEIRSAP